jgi:hypothetical protein
VVGLAVLEWHCQPGNWTDRGHGQPANSLIPRLAALSAAAGLRELYESDEAQALAAPPSAAELLELVDGVIRFVQAGLEGGSRDRAGRNNVTQSIATSVT